MTATELKAGRLLRDDGIVPRHDASFESRLIELADEGVCRAQDGEAVRWGHLTAHLKFESGLIERADEGVCRAQDSEAVRWGDLTAL